MKRLALMTVLIFSVLIGGSIRAESAQQPPARPQGQAQDEFVPLKDIPPEEQLPAAPLVLGAYSFIWLAALVYVSMLWRRLGSVQKDLEALQRSARR